VKVAALEVPPTGVGFFTVTLTVPAVAMFEAEIWAVTCVLFTNAVGCAAPFHWTADDDIKFVPFAASVNAEPPAVASVGEMFETVGTGFVAAWMSNAMGREVPPPGAGFVTVTWAVPAAITSVAEMAAVISLVLTNVVVRGLPFQFTSELLMKFGPFTVSVNGASPAVALFGDRDVIVGTGLLPGLIVNEAAVDAPPPGVGFVTVTCMVPAVAMSGAWIVAVICVALTIVVVRALPFQFTTEVARKLVPLTVSVKAGPPAVVLVGEIVVSVGAGFGLIALLPSHPLIQTVRRRTPNLIYAIPADL
jgi:hypothetical protein